MFKGDDPITNINDREYQLFDNTRYFATYDELSNNDEIWKDIIFFEDIYQVSSFGRVRSLDRVITSKTGQTYKLPSKILKPYNGGNGYQLVTLRYNGKEVFRYVHILVANAFVKIPEDLYHKSKKLIVNHKDGDKHHNHYLNLEWVTYSENNIHALDNYLRFGYCENHYNSKLSNNDVIKIRELLLNDVSINSIADMFNVNRTTIYDIKTERTWRRLK